MKPYGMSITASRIFLAIDEWLGILIVLYLAHTNSPWFYHFLVPFVVFVYLIGYPFHFYREYLAEKARKSILDQPPISIKLLR